MHVCFRPIADIKTPSMSFFVDWLLALFVLLIVAWVAFRILRALQTGRIVAGRRLKETVWVDRKVEPGMFNLMLGLHLGFIPLLIWFALA